MKYLNISPSGSEGGARTHDILINSQAQLPAVLPRNILKLNRAIGFPPIGDNPRDVIFFFIQTLKQHLGL